MSRVWSIVFVSFTVLGTVACVEQSAELPTEEELKAARENVLTTAPTPKLPVNAELEDKLIYLGLDVDTDKVTPGKSFTLTHYWKVVKPLGDDWRVFVHLEAPGTKGNHLNADHVPISGKYPVGVWKTGEIIRDIHRVSIPAGWTAPFVEVYTGAWKGSLRLKVTKGPQDGENRLLAAKLPVEVKPAEKKRLVAFQVKPGAIKIDGKLDEKEWATTMISAPFVKTIDGKPADQKTTVRAVWDDKNIYFAFDSADRDIWTTLTKHDDKLWGEEAVEVFLDADGDGKTYVELQVNPKATTFDSYLPVYRKNQNDWESNMKVGVKVDGSLDNRKDEDKGWTVEIAVPIEAARGREKEMKNVPPVVGTEWRANFFRLDMPAGSPQAGWGWSPPMVGDFHALDKFGVLAFADDAGHTTPVAPAAEPAAPAGDKKAAGKGPAAPPKDKAPAAKAKK